MPVVCKICVQVEPEFVFSSYKQFGPGNKRNSVSNRLNTDSTWEYTLPKIYLSNKGTGISTLGPVTLGWFVHCPGFFGDDWKMMIIMIIIIIIIIIKSESFIDKKTNYKIRPIYN